MDWFSYLKLRGSWGKLGNERIGAYDDDGNFIYNYYPYQAAIDYSTALFQNSQGIVSSVTTAAQQKYAVRDISWETTESWDIGLDANFLDNRLHFSADYYRKNTKDMLLALEIPHFIGYDNRKSMPETCTLPAMILKLAGGTKSVISLTPFPLICQILPPKWET